jgi:hypothetical protein
MIVPVGNLRVDTFGADLENNTAQRPGINTRMGCAMATAAMIRPARR